MKIATTASNFSTGHCQRARLASSKRSTLLGGISLGLGQRYRRDIDREHIESALRQEHAVAALAIGEAEHPLTGGESVGLGREEGVRRRPKRKPSAAA
jgi:hypothetical protein